MYIIQGLDLVLISSRGQVSNPRGLEVLTSPSKLSVEIHDERKKRYPFRKIRSHESKSTQVSTSPTRSHLVELSLSFQVVKCLILLAV